MVVDHSTGQPVGGAIVLLEQRDAGGIDRAVKSTTTAADGSFIAGDLTAGNYDVVIAASVPSDLGATVTYAATVTFGVPANAALDRIPLVPEYGASTPNAPPAEIAAIVTTAGAGGVPTAAEIKLSALEGQITIPAFAGSSDPVTGTYSPAGTSYTIPPQSPQEVVYLVEGKAFLAGSAGTPDCAPSTETAGPAVPRGTLASHITNLAFTGCQ
jgi:hypothetical protein